MFVKHLKYICKNIKILFVEDIVDSGKTIDYLIKIFQLRHSKSIKVCTLLDKTEARKVDVQVDYACFNIGNEFVAGYGLDYAKHYRNVLSIGVLKEEIYKK